MSHTNPPQEQESYIHDLAAENSARNASFARILLALPIAATLPYIPSLVHPPTAMLALLSITSLLSTAFLLYSLPHHVTGIAVLDRKKSATRTNKTQRQKDQLGFGAAQSPLEIYLPYLNLGLVVLLALMGLVTKSDAPSFGFIGMGNLPVVVYGVVLLAKMVMASVDPESELSGLKYQYKGA